MKPFELDPKMLTLRGVFYPTGYIFAMFPQLEDAEKVDRELRARNYEKNDETILLKPEDILGKVVSTVGGADMPLPSAGSEATTARQYAELASQGHHALMIHAPSKEESDRVMDVVRTAPFSIAERYRTLVIEDLE
jgi:hypothetical protein